MKKALHILLIIVNIAVAVAIVSSAMAGGLNPDKWPRLAILSMTFPVWPPLAILVLIADFFASRRWCMVMSVAIALSLPMIFTVFPLNIKRGPVPPRLADRSWTLMTYNAYNLRDITHVYPGGQNPTVEYILDVDPDIVVMEECEFASDKTLHITPRQRGLLKSRYPWTMIDGDIAVYSRFPATPVQIGEITDGSGTKLNRVRAWDMDIHGEKVLVVGVHLCSLGLTANDKELYRELTNGAVTSRDELRDVKLELINKIGMANIVRAAQARYIAETIDSLGYSNVVVCGDFNDTPGCYAMRTLASAGLRDVYPLAGNGYSHTYNANRLYFQIDHIMFRGDLRPWSITRGDIKSSDHYPLTVTFVPSE